MGFFDKLKGAVNFVTGGAAKVSIEWSPASAQPGDPIQVRVTVTSTGPAIKSGGVFVDVAAHETLNIPKNGLHGDNEEIHHAQQTFSQSYPIAPAFQLGPNESRQYQGQIALPPHVQPTYDGPFADHDWGIRGRVDMTGNDPDSGYQKFVVGRKV
jgi:hypothetical protein